MRTALKPVIPLLAAGAVILALVALPTAQQPESAGPAATSAVSTAGRAVALQPTSTATSAVLVPGLGSGPANTRPVISGQPASTVGTVSPTPAATSGTTPPTISTQPPTTSVARTTSPPETTSPAPVTTTIATSKPVTTSTTPAPTPAAVHITASTIAVTTTVPTTTAATTRTSTTTTPKPTTPKTTTSKTTTSKTTTSKTTTPKTTTPKPATSKTTTSKPTTITSPSAPGFGIPVTVGNATQLLVVRASSASSTVGTLTAWQRGSDGVWRVTYGPVSAHLGSQGIGAASEYASRTPNGTFTLTQAFGVLADPGTALPYFTATTKDWWVSDTASALYNTHQVCSPGNCSFDESVSEDLGTIRPQYDYAVVMDVNSDPVVAGGGSAFFLHVSDGGPTAGCVSVDKSALVTVMRWLDPAAHPRIAIGVG